MFLISNDEKDLSFFAPHQYICSSEMHMMLKEVSKNNLALMLYHKNMKLMQVWKTVLLTRLLTFLYAS